MTAVNIKLVTIDTKNNYCNKDEDQNISLNDWLGI